MSLRGRKSKHPGLEPLDGGRNKRQPQTVEIPGDYPEMPGNFPYPEIWHDPRTRFEENGVPLRSTDVYDIEDLCWLIANIRLERLAAAAAFEGQDP